MRSRRELTYLLSVFMFIILNIITNTIDEMRAKKNC